MVVVGVRAADRRGHAGVRRDRGPEVDEPRSLQITLDPDEQFTPGSPSGLNSAARRQPPRQPAEPRPASPPSPYHWAVADVLSGGPPLSRLERDGGFAALPDAGPTRPGVVATGPGRILAAVPRGQIPDLLVLTSSDDGESWRTERVA